MPVPREPHPDRPQPHPSDEALAAARLPDEPRSFDTDAPPGGHLGSAGDPAEGKRD